MASNYSIKAEADVAQNSNENFRNYTEFLPDEMIHEILSWLPLHKLFQLQSVCHSWRNIVYSSHNFHILWEERNNSDRWLVLNTNQKQARGRENDNDNDKDLWVALFNRRAGRWFYKKTLSTSKPSSWYLGDAAGGLLLYISKDDGTLIVVNPLTMHSHTLPDPSFMTPAHEPQQLSFFLKGEQGYASTNIVVDSIAGTYQVIVYSYFATYQLLIYSSAKLSWDIKKCNLSGWPIFGSWLSYKTLCSNQTVYCFPLEGGDYAFGCRASYNFSGTKLGQIFLARDGDGCHAAQPLGWVQHGGTVMQAFWSPPTGRKAWVTYELDEASCQWNAIFFFRQNLHGSTNPYLFAELLYEKDFVGTCGGDRDCIWIKPTYTDMICTDKINSRRQKEIMACRRKEIMLCQRQLISTATDEIKVCQRQNLQFEPPSNPECKKTKAFPTPLRFSPCP